MGSIVKPVYNPPSAVLGRICRVLLLCAVVTAFAAVVLQAFAVEAFHVPTGSMAPALLGHHRLCVCSRCGSEIAVGRQPADTRGDGDARFYRKAFCANCGHFPLNLADTMEIPGDQVNVDKTAYLRRQPSRWEIVVFRLLGALYIKRLLGLPDEEIAIRSGDVYINGRLCRKSLDEALRMRVLVFDQDKAPANIAWRQRWERRPQSAAAIHADGIVLAPGETLTYRNFLLDERKCEPIRDEYAYNGGWHAGAERVHDFLIETGIEVQPGKGSLALRLCDGGDWVEVLLPVGGVGAVEAFAWPVGAPHRTRKLGDGAARLALRPDTRHHAVLAFVDRRVSLEFDGALCFSFDMPATPKRAGVIRPFAVATDGVAARLVGFRLYRDVHYSQQGRNAVRGQSVRLGTDQYFMLGDNSANSEDSRYWPDGGRVQRNDLIGPISRLRLSR